MRGLFVWLFVSAGCARVRPHYEKMGLLGFEAGKAAPDLTANDLLNDA